jgi:subtilisin family serine protease
MTKPARHRLNHQTRRLIQVRPILEQLEARRLLAADLQMDYEQPATAWYASSDLQSVDSSRTMRINWFEQLQAIERIPLSDLQNVDRKLPEGIAGPNEPATGEWLVQLTDAATASLRSLAEAKPLLNQSLSEFTIIGGLGKPGSLLVRGKGPTRGSIESELQSNPSVNHFSLNQRIEGQATSPNDPEFVAGLMPGMEQIDATNAWDVSRGSLSTVVGVVDTGIDPTHSDLYLNIWINQGELPPSYLDNVGTKLTDIDSDGLITFYDLNNVTRSTTAPYAITVG